MANKIDLKIGPVLLTSRFVSAGAMAPTLGLGTDQVVVDTGFAMPHSGVQTRPRHPWNLGLHDLLGAVLSLRAVS
jgi:hypothetical protein